MAKLANENQGKLLQIVQKEKSSIVDSRRDDLQKKSSLLVDEIKHLEDELQQIFEEKVKGVISETIFEKLSSQYYERVQKANLEKKKVENVINVEKEMADFILDWIEKIKQY